MIEGGKSMSAASTLDAIMTDPHRADAVAVLIDAPVRRHAVRVNVSLPTDVMEAIDRVSDNRSRFLADAAREKLRQGYSEGASTAAQHDPAFGPGLRYASSGLLACCRCLPSRTEAAPRRLWAKNHFRHHLEKFLTIVRAALASML